MNGVGENPKFSPLRIPVGFLFLHYIIKKENDVNITSSLC